MWKSKISFLQTRLHKQTLNTQQNKCKNVQHKMVFYDFFFFFFIAMKIVNWNFVRFLISINMRYWTKHSKYTNSTLNKCNHANIMNKTQQNKQNT